jgi:hypothetical protein
MKKLLPVITLLLVLFIADKSLAQGLPKIDSIKVKTSSLPGNPLFITAIIRTPSSHTIKINSSFLIRNDTVFLSGCYISGPLQTPGMTRDTFNIGTLNPGTYTIHYKAYLSGNFNFCDSSSSQIKTQTFSVNSPLGIKHLESINQAIFFPNPVQDKLRIQGISMQSISITDLSGKKIKEYKLAGETKTSVSLADLAKGIYLVEIRESNGSQIRKKVIKE